MVSSNTPPIQHSTAPTLFSDYHTHPQGHRVRPYTLELLQPWVDAARKARLTEIAFTDHDRYHAGIDLDVLDQLRERNADVKVLAGIELDNDPESSPAGREWVEKNWDRLDFVLGSVHFLAGAGEMFDSVPDGARQFEGRDVDAVYSDYFAELKKIAASGLVDCLSHLDLVKIHGHRPLGKIASFVNNLLDFVSSEGLALELSTAGWRKPVNELYPADEIIRLAQGKGIRFTTASDAHSYAQLGENYDRLAEKMAQLGVREVCTFERHKPNLQPLI